MAEIHLIATLRPADGKHLQLRHVLCQTAAEVASTEPGCLTFVVMECQNSKRSNDVEFKVFERWATGADLVRHQERDWLKEMYRTFEEQSLLDSPETIEKLEFVSGFISR